MILDRKAPIEGLNDSKQLTAKRRQTLFKEIKNKALAYAYAFVDETIIDQINIYQASKKAMLIAIEKLNVEPDYILSDAMPLEIANQPCLAIIKGDTLSASIAAASIVAKEVRDEYMMSMAERYPGYDFANNKGYPTKKHLTALRQLGPSEIHRKSFKPVKEMLEEQLTIWEEL